MGIDRALRRHFWSVFLLLVVAAAFFDARAIANLVAVVIAPDAAQLAIPSRVDGPSKAVDAPSPHVTNAASILARNPFDSETGPLGKAPDAEQAPVADDEPVSGDPTKDPICEAVKVLLITKADSPDYSFAVFSGSDTANGKTVLRRRNGDVGDKRVTWIGEDRVWLTSGKRRCQAQLFGPPAAPDAAKDAAPAKPTEAAKPSVGASTLDPVIAGGIHKNGPNAFSIDRAIIDKILENQAELIGKTRIVPEQENGKSVGIRMFGVRDGTLLAALGMENGDRLQQINGFDMGSPESALEAYARLRVADHLVVQVNRKGATTNLDYDIK